jgi:hypothetical protein
MTPEEQQSALETLNDQWFENPPSRGAAGIAQITEFLAAYMLEQERIIRENFRNPGPPLSWPALFGALQYRAHCAISRIDWHLTEITGEFQTSFKEPLYTPSEAPQTVEEVQ